MSKNNYMGKIDEDYTGTTIPNYDSPKKCRNCKSASFARDYQELKKAKNLKIILRKILYGKKLKFGSEVKWNNYLKIIKNYFYPIKKGGDK